MWRSVGDEGSMLNVVRARIKSDMASSIQRRELSTVEATGCIDKLGHDCVSPHYSPGSELAECNFVLCA